MARLSQRAQKLVAIQEIFDVGIGHYDCLRNASRNALVYLEEALRLPASLLHRTPSLLGF